MPQITARAGLTTRTFFRHFSDKREVIFGDDEIPDIARKMLLEAPVGDEPMALIIRGLNELAGSWFEPQRERIRLARRLIASDAGLRERDLRKQTELQAVIESGLVARGESRLDAAMAAALAVEVLHLALERWLEATQAPDGPDLHSCLEEAWRTFIRLADSSRTPRADS